MKTAIYDELIQYPWLHMVTVRLPPDATDPDTAYEALAIICRTLSRTAGTPVAAIGAHNYRRTAHIHALLAAREAHRLAAVTQDDLRSALTAAGSDLAAPGAVRLERVFDASGAVDYLTKNLPARTQKGALLHYGRRLLTQLHGHQLRRPAPRETNSSTTPRRYASRLHHHRTGAVLPARIIMDAAQIHGQPDLRAGDILDDLGTARRYQVTADPRSSSEWGDHDRYIHITLTLLRGRSAA